MTQSYLHNVGEFNPDYKGPAPTGEVLGLCRHRLDVVINLIKQVEAGLPIKQDIETQDTSFEEPRNPLLDSPSSQTSVNSSSDDGRLAEIRQRIDSLGEAA